MANNLTFNKFFMLRPYLASDKYVYTTNLRLEQDENGVWKNNSSDLNMRIGDYRESNDLIFMTTTSSSGYTYLHPVLGTYETCTNYLLTYRFLLGGQTRTYLMPRSPSSSWGTDYALTMEAGTETGTYYLKTKTQYLTCENALTNQSQYVTATSSKTDYGLFYVDELDWCFTTSSGKIPYDFELFSDDATTLGITGTNVWAKWKTTPNFYFRCSIGDGTSATETISRRTRSSICKPSPSTVVTTGDWSDYAQETLNVSTANRKYAQIMGTSFFAVMCKEIYEVQARSVDVGCSYDGITGTFKRETPATSATFNINTYSVPSLNCVWSPEGLKITASSDYLAQGLGVKCQHVVNKSICRKGRNPRCY